MATKHRVEEQTENGLIIRANYQPSGGKTWLAEITGEHEKYGLDRNFINETSRDRSSSGKTGQNYYHVKEGNIYEINVAWGDRFFFTVEDGELKELEEADVLNEVTA